MKDGSYNNKKKKKKHHGSLAKRDIINVPPPVYIANTPPPPFTLPIQESNCYDLIPEVQFRCHTMDITV